ncbi:Nitric oxide reductase transcription regulator NorR2 [Pigmentiphaga humi]|uniref:Nitric oxide reductase transcription regulator NorR2 n=1 Tax=Pigmentiphaga humi TaxID=2478468 RepID=A0A3P4B4S7_9BURK|nr:nitric oxide reductase transcriptional regulator NorR [Pigmentiphaga humi]VCU70670.1 Nitric oxide reductase transcription regulator NorR2 [Pigmentiphaga humi]
MDAFLLADLVTELSPEVRFQRLVTSLRAHFRCGAVALLRLEQDHLLPMAVDGLAQDTLGRRFAIGEHPRFVAILNHRGVLHFRHDDALPDPYDGLLTERAGEAMPVHDCMGVGLHVEGSPWGVLTLDALEIGAFGSQAREDLAHFAPLIEAAVRTTRLEAEIRALRSARGALPAGSIAALDDDIVGQSDAIGHLLHEIDVVADSELPILLLGETGVGKELFARRLHRLSRRRERPLVHVNCAALPETLAESELFGHARGAFSGAVSERPGRFDAANHGTLFLDEVGELPLSVQAKLLRTLQNGEIQRLGADRPRQVDVRVIAATNRSLRDLVRDGAFRADLYHRLSVYPVPIPPLRERGNDVLLLAGRFLEINRTRLGVRSLRLAPEAEAALRRYQWPGNVRELEHVISRAAIKAVSRGADRNAIVTLPAGLLDLDGVAPLGAPDPVRPLAANARAAAAGVTLKTATEAGQREAIRAALDRHAGNWTRAARQLGVDASNLHKLARRLGLKQARSA